jgi:HSP20 family molecular chaperone IbpA
MSEITPNTPATELKQPVAGESTRPGRSFRPLVDIAESEDGLRLWADMPGVDEKSIEIELNENVLRIHGTVSPDDYDQLAPVYTEYNVGNFEHRFRLSSEIDGGKIEAKLNHGVLELLLPKVAAAQPRRIEIGS